MTVGWGNWVYVKLNNLSRNHKGSKRQCWSSHGFSSFPRCWHVDTSMGVLTLGKYDWYGPHITLKTSAYKPVFTFYSEVLKERDCAFFTLLSAMLGIHGLSPATRGMSSSQKSAVTRQIISLFFLFPASIPSPLSLLPFLPRNVNICEMIVMLCQWCV